MYLSSRSRSQRRSATTTLSEVRRRFVPPLMRGVPTPGTRCMQISAGRQADQYPSLRSFLESANTAATDAIQGNVQAECTDPRRWLNPAGHDLLSELPGFETHNASMLWGTYRPGVYFGERNPPLRYRATGWFCLWPTLIPVDVRTFL